MYYFFRMVLAIQIGEFGVMGGYGQENQVKMSIRNRRQAEKREICSRSMTEEISKKGIK